MTRLRSFLSISLALFLLAVPAYAQEQARTLRVLVIGDVLAAGLGAGLQRAAPGAGLKLDIETRFKEDSGLARPEIYDWNQALPRILESRDFDIAAVIIGTNDVQPMRGAGGAVAFESEEWRAAYAANVGQLIGTLKNSSIAVFWVGLPPMSAGTYDRSIRIVSAAQQASAESQGARYIDTRAEFGSADGGYRDSGPDEFGVVRRLRTRDGVRFLKPGNTVLGKLLAAAIKEDALNNSATATVDEPDLSKGPSFGQDAPVGQDNILRPELPTTEEKASANADAEEGPDEPVKRPAQQRPEPQPGSAADKLFSDGLWPDPPKGRFDDVRVQP